MKNTQKHFQNPLLFHGLVFIALILLAASFKSPVAPNERIHGYVLLDTLKKTKEDKTIYVYVENMPQYKGGMDLMFKFIRDNLVYPDSLKKMGINGRVYVQFVVTKFGKIKNTEVVRSVNYLLDKEALKVIRIMPDWIPGTQNGKPVNVQFVIPINFR